MHSSAASQKLSLFAALPLPSAQVGGAPCLLLHFQEQGRGEMCKGAQIALKPPSGRQDLLISDSESGPELGAGKVHVWPGWKPADHVARREGHGGV